MAKVSDQSPLKLPPQALEAEQSLLGGVLLDNQKWIDVSEQVGVRDFYNRNHQLIFNAILQLQSIGDPADVVTTAEWLDTQGELEHAGGLSYIGSLANQTPSTANTITYAKIVRERSILRSLISVANTIADSAYTPEGRTPREVLDQAEQLVFDISERDGRSRQGFMPIQSLAEGALRTIEEIYESGSPISGLATGFQDLDEMTSGLQKGDLIIIAGRPSMGKTSFAMNIAEYVTVAEKVPVAVFSLEMPGEHLAMRLISSLSSINSSQIRSGRIKEQDWPRLTNAVKSLEAAPLYIDDTAGLNPLDLRSRARRFKHEHPEIGLIVIDYLQLMQATDTQENRATELSGITRSLKILAKELNVPVVALSQLNRSLENRTSKRPVLSDLRESGAIEQDADVIMFIYRDVVYNEQTEEANRAELIIGKQRNGPIGTVNLTYRDELMRFESYAHDPYQGTDHAR